ncbi:MAG: phage holin family protein [Gammaproteobacteria bacterium]|nr:phage holin family protein [Gammaproteobacteria bacterium]
MQSDKPNKVDRSIGALIRDLTYELTSLVSKEAELAKAEASEKVSQVGAGIAALVVAAVLLVVGLEELTDAATVGVGYLLPPTVVPWLAPLIVGGVIAIIGLILLMKGRSNLQPQNLAPNRTTESLRKDKAVAQEQFR